MNIIKAVRAASLGIALLGILALQFLADRPKDLEMVVRGRVSDWQGRPVEKAKIRARLGLDLDGSVVFSDNDGFFLATVKAEGWFKGSPSLSIQAEGLREEVVYFDRWYRGRREFTHNVMLKR